MSIPSVRNDKRLFLHDSSSTPVPSSQVLKIERGQDVDSFVWPEGIQVLRLKKSHWDYPDLFTLFSKKVPPTLIELELSPLDLNKKDFTELLKLCGKNLLHIRIEHAETPDEETQKLTKRKSKEILTSKFPNEREVRTVKNLKNIEVFCPHLNSVTFVNVNFAQKLWMKDLEWKSNYIALWKKIFRYEKLIDRPNKLYQRLERIRFKGLPEDYEDMVAFLEEKKFDKLRRLILKDLSYKQETLADIKKNHPNLEITLKTCSLSK